MSIRRTITNTGETKWQVRVYDGGRGSRRINRRFDKKIEAEEFLFNFNKEKEEKSRNPFKNCSFDSRIFEKEADHWLNDGKLRFSDSHLKRVNGILRELLPRFGKLSLDKFTPELLSAYQQTEKAKALSNSTVNRKTEVILSILSFSTRSRRIPFNPSVGFKKLATPQTEMFFWSITEALSFLRWANGTYPPGRLDRWKYVVYLLALNTAMRAGEIWGLQPQDLMPSRSSIKVRRQFNRVTQNFGPPKSKKARVVPCNPELFKELKTLISRKNIRATETIFQNGNRRPICHDNFSDRTFQQDLKGWGGRPIRFHDLRHTATTLLIGSGVDIKTVKEICGHSDISTTMNYVHMLPKSIELVANRFSISPGREVGELDLHGLSNLASTN